MDLSINKTIQMEMGLIGKSYAANINSTTINHVEYAIRELFSFPSSWYSNVLIILIFVWKQSEDDSHNSAYTEQCECGL